MSKFSLQMPLGLSCCATLTWFRRLSCQSPAIPHHNIKFNGTSAMLVADTYAVSNMFHIISTVIITTLLMNNIHSDLFVTKNMHKNKLYLLVKMFLNFTATIRCEHSLKSKSTKTYCTYQISIRFEITKIL